MSIVADQAHGVVTPAVSVVIPTRGRPALLREAIASALAQTFADLEVIVVEDGGDDARAVVDSFGQRVRHMSQSHQGVSVARNAGVADSAARHAARVAMVCRFVMARLLRGIAVRFGVLSS